MEPQGSSPHSQVTVTCLYPLPARSSPYPHTSHFLKIQRSILILYSHLSLGLPSDLFLSGFPTKTLYTPLLSPIRATCPVHRILLDFITRKVLNEQYRSLSFSVFSFLHSPVTSSLLGPNILLNTLFSNTLSLCSSLNVSDQVSHPYKTPGKIIVPYYIHTYINIHISWVQIYKPVSTTYDNACAHALRIHVRCIHAYLHTLHIMLASTH